MCKKEETYIGKTVGDNIVGFKSRMNQRTSNSRTRTGVSTWKFSIYIYDKCGLTNKSLNVPFFEIDFMINLKSCTQLETYGSYFHKKDYNSLNCPEHLKK